MSELFFPSHILETAVHEISKLPGIGKKTALRLSMHILKQDNAYANNLGEAIIRLKEEIKYCSKCYTISDSEICEICSNPLRESSTVCIVENIKDVLAIENTGQYRGYYHVLGGIISPMEGVGPTDLTIEELVKRVESEGVKEIIFALPVTIEGDTTSFYIYKRLKEHNIKITMLSRGVSVGDELEYADEATLARSLRDRVDYIA